MTRSTLTFPVDPCDDLAALCERLKLPEVGRLHRLTHPATHHGWTQLMTTSDSWRILRVLSFSNNLLCEFR